MSKRLKNVLIISSVVIVIIVLFLVTGNSYSPEIVDENGDAIVGSIVKEVMLPVGGTDQWVLIRGFDITNPVIVVLHGGPGMTMNGNWLIQQSALEEDFTMVYWDQRGCGKSYDAALTEDTMTVAQMLSDLHEIIAYVKNETGQEQVILFGHSWGTILGTYYAALNPDDLLAYVSTGQVSNDEYAEGISYEWALGIARESEDEEAVEALESIGMPPYTFDQLEIKSKYITAYDGYGDGGQSAVASYLEMLSSKEYSYKDLWGIYKGAYFSLDVLQDEVATVNFFKEVPELNVPAIFPVRTQ